MKKKIIKKSKKNKKIPETTWPPLDSTVPVLVCHMSITDTTTLTELENYIKRTKTRCKQRKLINPVIQIVNNYDGFDCEFWAERPETKEEQKIRLKQYQEQIEQHDEREKKLYLELKKKYG